ncbi:MAG: hypothetical protein IBX67_00260 [Dehalococcoidia bacterium]|nr:hypothetical protein [Dehalococcoidia bacterium]
MTKRSRRSKAKYQSRPARPEGSRPVQQPRAMPSEPASPARVLTRAQDPAIRYRHVMPEVRRIGIIAGVMILVLIVLSFVIG